MSEDTPEKEGHTAPAPAPQRVSRMFKTEIQRARTISVAWVVVVMAIAVAMFLWSGSAMRLYDPQSADLGVEILQPAVVSMVYVCIGVVFSALLAAFVESAMKEHSFSPWLSRYAMLFTLFFIGFCWIAASIL